MRALARVKSAAQDHPVRWRRDAQMRRRGAGRPAEGDLYGREDFRASILCNREDPIVCATHLDVGRALYSGDVETFIINIDCFSRLYFEY